jgi:tRNA(Ile)-lysidine synthetase-like protein
MPRATTGRLPGFPPSALLTGVHDRLPAEYYRAMGNASGTSRSDATESPEAALPLAARRHRLLAELDRRLRLHCRSIVGGPLVVGVSGGADSVALLLGCLALSRRTRRRALQPPIAAHVHHHLRGESADEDAEFVTDLCRRFGVPLHVEHVRPGSLPGNVADNARQLRYAALKRIAQREGAAAVAVAHHADDQFETMLIALCRGTGVEGLTGMPRTRPLGDGIALLRPLLGVRRAECEEFCRAADVTWRDDPSNADIKNLRARLRRDVLPVLEALWPDAPTRAAATADALDVARMVLAERIEQAFGLPGARCWPRQSLAELPLPILAAGLRRAALDEAPDLSDAFGQRILLPAAEAIASDDRKPKQFDWPGGLLLAVTKHEVRLERRSC